MNNRINIVADVRSKIYDLRFGFLIVGSSLLSHEGT
jgi:hypothetical protein